jgi:hypothetical protein
VSLKVSLKVSLVPQQLVDQRDRAGDVAIPVRDRVGIALGDADDGVGDAGQIEAEREMPAGGLECEQSLERVDEALLDAAVRAGQHAQRGLRIRGEELLQRNT